MEKIKGLIDELKNLKKDFEDKKKYNLNIEDRISLQVNFTAKGKIPESLKIEIKKLIRAF